MRVTILSIGDELVLGQRPDTNAAWLADALLGLSCETVEMRAVPDDREALAAAIRDLAARSDIIVMTGGLGPTADDVTRAALGDVVDPGRELVLDEAGLATIRAWFRHRGRDLVAINEVQAQRPPSMLLIENRQGTAPGLAGATSGTLLFALPGPPREMTAMFEAHIAPALAARRCHGDAVLTECVHLYGLGESDAAARLGDLMSRDRATLVGTTASDGIVSARVRARGPLAEAQHALAHAVETIERAWAPYAFGRGTVSLASAVGALIRSSGRTLATAESCTGGWLGKMIVDEPGASDYYLGGVIAYSNALKSTLLGVRDETIAAEGAVSAAVAGEMATGALRATLATCALAITGVAGPGGGGAQKPAGTVYIALALAPGADVRVRQFRFRGDRSVVRDRSAKSALQMLRLALVGADPELPMLYALDEARARS